MGLLLISREAFRGS
jgi:hypothetical protein